MDKEESKQIGGICPKCHIFLYCEICPACGTKVALAKVGVIMEKKTSKQAAIDCINRLRCITLVQEDGEKLLKEVKIHMAKEYEIRLFSCWGRWGLLSGEKFSDYTMPIAYDVGQGFDQTFQV